VTANQTSNEPVEEGTYAGRRQSGGKRYYAWQDAGGVERYYAKLPGSHLR
jgi:hypothetical protein